MKSLEMQAEDALALVLMATNATAATAPVAVVSPDAAVGQNLKVLISRLVLAAGHAYLTRPTKHGVTA